MPLLLAIELGEGDAELVRRLQRRDPRAMADCTTDTDGWFTRSSCG
jgi:hypothetical protein